MLYWQLCLLREKCATFERSPKRELVDFSEADDLFKLIMIFTVTDNPAGVKRYKSSILDYWGTELVYFYSRIVLS